jgi:hypothetical protein
MNVPLTCLSPQQFFEQSELTHDKKFLKGLHKLRENWNIRPLTRSTLNTFAIAGPVGSLCVHLGLITSGSTHSDDCDAAILRAADGSVVVRMGRDFMSRRMSFRTDANHVAISTDGLRAGQDVTVPPKGTSNDAYLLAALRSVLENDVFKTMAKEAVDTGGRLGVHAAKFCVTSGPVVVRMNARKISDGESSSQKEEESSSSRAIRVEETENPVMPIMARQLLRCEHRIRRKNKPAQG